MTETNKFLDHKCRTCFKAAKGWNHLTTKTRDFKKRLKSYGEMLEEITKIETMDNKNKELPQLICGDCSRRLKSAHSFIQQAAEVNEKLHSMLKNNSKCLHELQLDIEFCKDIKVENNEQEPKVENLECLQETPIDIEPRIKINVENNEQESWKGELNCLQEAKQIEVDSGTAIKVENNYTLNFVKDSVIKSAEILEKKYGVIKQYTSSDDEEDSEYMQSDESGWKDDEKPSDRKAKTSTKNIENLDIAVPCNKCNKIFKNSKLLALHQKTSHIPQEKKCTCQLCGNKFTRYCNMYTHMRTFHGPETVPLSKRPEEDYIYKCDKCPKKYSRKKCLIFHTKLKHSTGEINENKTNNDDGKKMADKGSLCPICGKVFVTKRHLTAHLRLHSGEKPFKCDWCDRAFLVSAHLNRHMRQHTGDKPHKCQLCEKCFATPKDLRQHMISHSDERPNKCSQCERCYKFPADLKVHLRTHSGERPFVCAACGASFYGPSSLRAHRKRHEKCVVVSTK